MPNLLPSSLKILDFTRLLPGPKLTSLLSSLGATVTKIESPIRPDTTQSQHPGLYYQLNHDKELRIVDYNTDEGREEILELARESDVIVEGFRPGKRVRTPRRRVALFAVKAVEHMQHRFRRRGDDLGTRTSSALRASTSQSREP